MTLALDISGVLGLFPDYRAALVVARGFSAGPDQAAALEEAVRRAEAMAAADLANAQLAEIPELAVWRAAYKRFGVKKTSYRSSVERLLKQAQQGRGLPRVGALVDCYNAVSLRHRMPIGADDLAKLSGDLAFRVARDGDNFFALGASPAQDDPPKSGEVVYADAEKILCRRWNWYQDARSATTPQTRDAALTVQWLGGAADLERATEELCAWLGEFGGARTAWVIADARQPRAEVALD
jgi:DNA/RNA-binding domain of Phe-tRNA-synthetase-like protein